MGIILFYFIQFKYSFSSIQPLIVARGQYYGSTPFSKSISLDVFVYYFVVWLSMFVFVYYFVVFAIWKWKWVS
jgi:hypothetical protein